MLRQRRGGRGEQCAFVEDTPADVLAGLLAGVPVIGFANKPGKAQPWRRRAREL